MPGRGARAAGLDRTRHWYSSSYRPKNLTVSFDLRVTSRNPGYTLPGSRLPPLRSIPTSCPPAFDFLRVHQILFVMRFLSIPPFNRGRKVPVCRDEPQKGLPILAKSSKNTLVTSPPKRPRIPAKKVLKQTQYVVIKFP